MFTALVFAIRLALSFAMSFLLSFMFTAIAVIVMPGSVAAIIAAVVASVFVGGFIDFEYNTQMYSISVFAALSIFTAYYKTANFVKSAYNSVINFVDHFTCDLFNKKNAIFRVA